MESMSEEIHGRRQRPCMLLCCLLVNNYIIIVFGHTHCLDIFSFSLQV